MAEMTTSALIDPDFPCSLYVFLPMSCVPFHIHIHYPPRKSYFSLLIFHSLTRTIHTPLPTARLASYALLTLRVDQELSPLVRRSFSTIYPSSIDRPSSSLTQIRTEEPLAEEQTVLVTKYKATTNRMLRVAVNGFLESLRLVLEVMQELDEDVMEAARPRKEADGSK